MSTVEEVIIPKEALPESVRATDVDRVMAEAKDGVLARVMGEALVEVLAWEGAWEELIDFNIHLKSVSISAWRPALFPSTLSIFFFYNLSHSYKTIVFAADLDQSQTATI